MSDSHGSDHDKKELVNPNSPSNFKLIDGTIKNETQRLLYKRLMTDSKAKNKGLKFDLMRVQVEDEEPNETELGQALKTDSL